MPLLNTIAREIKKRIPGYSRIRPMVNGWREKPIKHGEGWRLSASNLAMERPYLVLTLKESNGKKAIRIKIIPWAEEERLAPRILRALRKLAVKERKEKKSPFAWNPIYVSSEMSEEDIEALIALRLLQESEGQFYGTIEEWLKKAFPGEMRRTGDPSEVIEYLRAHFYFPEDWRGWRRYVKKAFKKFHSHSEGREIGVHSSGEEEDKGLGIEKISQEEYRERCGTEEAEGESEIEEIRREEIKRAHRPASKGIYRDWGSWIDEETGKLFYTVKRTLELTGVPEVTLYRWIKKGKVTPKDTGRGFMVLDKDEVEKVSKQKKIRKALAKKIAENRGISYDSARRQIRRLELKGLSQEEILEKAKPLLASHRN